MAGIPYQRRRWLARLRELERATAQLQTMLPYVPGNDASVPGTAAWIAAKAMEANERHTYIVRILKDGRIA